jgi:hypothetical protein
MRTAAPPFRSLAALLCVSAGSAGLLLCQVPNKTNATGATIVGRVIDTVGVPLEGAEVAVTLTVSRDSSVVRNATSDRRGNVVFADLPAGGPYTLAARKIGFGSARGSDVHLKGGDTLRVDFELPSVGVALPTITVTSRRGSRFAIAADEIEARKYPNALELAAWKRPYMLGDPDQCSPPLPPPWPVPRNAGGMGRRPWLNLSQFYDVFNPPYSPYVQRVYVNGRRIDRPGESPLIALHDVPSSQIAEMRYVDCTQTTDAWPYSIYIVLKSPSKEVQDSIWRSITRGAPAQP